MATQKPLTSPWTIVVPDTGIHKVDLSECSNFKQEMGIGGTPVTITVKVGSLLITVANEDVADPFTGNSIPLFTVGDKQWFTILPNQVIFVKGALADDAFIVAA